MQGHTPSLSPETSPRDVGTPSPRDVASPPRDVIASPPRDVIATPWQDVIILCRKCGKKRDGGFGPKRKDSLKTALRQALRDIGRRRQVRIMETACLGICPKGGVTALNATRPGTIHVIKVGTGGSDAVRALLGDRTGADGRGGFEAA